MSIPSFIKRVTNAILLLIITVSGSLLVQKRLFFETIILGLIVVACILIFNFYWAKRTKTKDDLHFSDDFSDFEGWSRFLEGNVIHSDDYSYVGRFSLKKTGFNEPNGGFKKISKIRRGFVFSGWIYRPSKTEGGPADRLAIEDDKGNGYGFIIRHENNSFIMGIEKRTGGVSVESLKAAIVNSEPLIDVWYNFNLHITKRAKIVLTIDCEKKRLANIQAEDFEFRSFQRIAVHGGYIYYVDSLKVRRA
ncbi:MAG: hypothetical protein ACLFUW_09995 [Bacteroidales bacterium]